MTCLNTPYESLSSRLKKEILPNLDENFVQIIKSSLIIFFLIRSNNFAESAVA